jgi:hypothetical protein
VHLDRSYDSDATRKRLEERALIGVISEKGKPAPLAATKRWVVERTNSWSMPTRSWCCAPSARGGSSTSGWPSRTRSSSWAGSFEKPGFATVGRADLLADHDLLAWPLRAGFQVRTSRPVEDGCPADGRARRRRYTEICSSVHVLKRNSHTGLAKRRREAGDGVHSTNGVAAHIGPTPTISLWSGPNAGVRVAGRKGQRLPSEPGTWTPVRFRRLRTCTRRLAPSGGSEGSGGLVLSSCGRAGCARRRRGARRRTPRPKGSA